MAGIDTVAVIVPAYNAGRTLEATLASVTGQSSVAEIVIIDDGSSDDTLTLARRHEPMVRVLTGPNQGVSAARNRGIAETSAPWLLFLDADDLLVPGTVSDRLEVAQRTSADVVIADWEDLIDGQRLPRSSIGERLSKGSVAFAVICRSSRMHGCCLMLLTTGPSLPTCQKSGRFTAFFHKACRGEIQ
jgi:glycosyltransferase involved in cell wall biosynthesis